MELTSGPLVDAVGLQSTQVDGDIRFACQLETTHDVEQQSEVEDEVAAPVATLQFGAAALEGLDRVDLGADLGAASLSSGASVRQLLSVTRGIVRLGHDKFAFDGGQARRDCLA